MPGMTILSSFRALTVREHALLEPDAIHLGCSHTRKVYVEDGRP